MPRKLIGKPPSHQGPKCEAIGEPATCKCAKGHATQLQCYHWPCPCAAEARAWFFAHQKEVQAARAREIATLENPLCVRCSGALAEPGYPFCRSCLDADKTAPKVAPEGIRQLDMD